MTTGTPDSSDKIQIGSKVYFQFDDQGVVRGASGTLVEVTYGGLYRCEFMGSSATVDCLPFAVRPVQFSHSRLRDKIKRYGDAKVTKEQAGGGDPSDVQWAYKNYNDKRRELYSYIRWLE